MRSFMHQRVNDPFSSAVVCLWGVYTVTPPPQKKKTYSMMYMQNVYARYTDR